VAYGNDTKDGQAMASQLGNAGPLVWWTLAGAECAVRYSIVFILRRSHAQPKVVADERQRAQRVMHEFKFAAADAH
jgi:hypothetical protein